MDPFAGFSLDTASSVPMTEQIKAHVVEQMRTGRCPPGQRLPPLRKVARDLSVSLTTVERAFRDLRVEGRVAGRAGRGSFVLAPRALSLETAQTLKMSPCRSLRAEQRERLARGFAAACPQTHLLLTDESADVVEIDLDMLPRVARDFEDIEEFACELYGRTTEGREVFAPLCETGRLQMLPTGMGHAAVLLNRDLFRQAGVPLPSRNWTWEESLETARALSRARVGAYAYAGGESATVLVTAVLQNDGSLYDASGRHCRLAEPEAVGAAEHLRRMAEFGAPFEDTLADVERNFFEGRLPMRVSRNWSYASVAQCPFEVEARPLPLGRRNVSILVATGFGLRKGAGARDAGLAMLRLLAGMESWPDFVARRPAVPLTRSLQDANPITEVFAETLRHARPVLHQVDPACRRDIHREALKLAHPALRAIRHGTEPVAAILARLRDHVNAMIESSELAPLARFQEN